MPGRNGQGPPCESCGAGRGMGPCNSDHVFGRGNANGCTKTRSEYKSCHQSGYRMHNGFCCQDADGQKEMLIKRKTCVEEELRSLQKSIDAL